MKNFRNFAVRSRQAAARASVQGGTYSSAVRDLYQPFYDSISLLSTRRENSLFTTGLGQGSKTLANTNFPQGGRIPAGNKFDVYGFGLVYIAHTNLATATVPLLHAMLANTSIELFINGAAPLYQRTLDQLMGAPMLGMVAPTVAGDNYHQLSMGECKGVDMLSKPITLEENVGIEVKVIHHTLPNAALDTDIVRIVMFGELRRTVG
ncbi:MAG TPA: hypothetical protein VLH56_19585 [Dissulfurispiraceae bacterium]|nr:hypothetical protein [Dissulfurispiraceae bacterium]